MTRKVIEKYPGLFTEVDQSDEKKKQQTFFFPSQNKYSFLI